MQMSDKLINVMVVEDEPVILKHTIEKIEKADSAFKVTSSALNGKEALSKIPSHKPDIVFTDIRMPVMDGIELIRKIRLDYPEMPVVVLSGYNEFEYAQQAIRLGVSEYLLKPLGEEQLNQTLKNLKSSLQLKYETLEISILSSELNGQSTDIMTPSSLKKSKFSMYLINICHLCNHLLSIHNSQLFSKLWSGIDWDMVIGKLAINIQNWWVVDEKMPNRKILLISSSQVTPQEIQDTAKVLQDTLIGYISPYPLNISTEYAFFHYSEIWVKAQRLRSQLEKSLVLGNSKVIAGLEENRNIDFPAKLIGTNTENTITSLIATDNKELLRKEIFKLFNSWEEYQYPQRSIEKALSQLFQIFQKSRITAIEADINDVESSILDKITSSTDFPGLYGFIWDSIKEVFIDEEPKKEYTHELVESIEQYLKMNYTEDISLEYLAKKFNFTSAYLTKIFKKYKNESPLKYLINLRINEAKHLISQHTELDMKTVAEMVGYYNQHYFSKVFKSMVGITPSEYRLDKAE
jgi:two-component system response regulator YesN